MEGVIGVAVVLKRISVGPQSIVTDVREVGFRFRRVGDIQAPVLEQANLVGDR